jgi:hypothetical protein
MHTKSRSQLPALNAGGDQGISWGSADAFADAIQHDHAGDRSRTAANNQQPQLTQGGQSIADRGDLLGPPPTIRHQSAGHPDQHGCALIDAVHHANLKRREAQRHQQIER